MPQIIFLLLIMKISFAHLLSYLLEFLVRYVYKTCAQSHFLSIELTSSIWAAECLISISAWSIFVGMNAYKWTFLNAFTAAWWIKKTIFLASRRAVNQMHNVNIEYRDLAFYSYIFPVSKINNSIPNSIPFCYKNKHTYTRHTCLFVRTL